MLGISQEELAFRAEIHRTYVSQIERGLKSPSLSIMFQLSTALEVKLSELFARLEELIQQSNAE
jgi:transcriptional regulator with XRE-family HTH domain